MGWTCPKHPEDGMGCAGCEEDLRQALTALVNAVEDAMETPEEAASWIRDNAMKDYLEKAHAVLR